MKPPLTSDERYDEAARDAARRLVRATPSSEDNDRPINYVRRRVGVGLGLLGAGAAIVTTGVIAHNLDQNHEVGQEYDTVSSGQNLVGIGEEAVADIAKVNKIDPAAIPYSEIVYAAQNAQTGELQPGETVQVKLEENGFGQYQVAIKAPAKAPNSESLGTKNAENDGLLANTGAGNSIAAPIETNNN